MRDKVGATERKKARFVNEYRQLCQKYNMMIVMAAEEEEEDDSDEEYMAFAVVNITKDPESINRACEEMLIGSLLEIDLPR